MDNLNIKTKMPNFEVHVLIGWLSQSIRKPANQNALLKVKHFFPGQLAFCKKAVVGLAARRIF